LHTVVAAARRRHRALTAAAGEWALARGVLLPPDHVALCAATAEVLGWLVEADGIIVPGRAADVPDFVSAIEAWCALNRCTAPATLTESLWHLYGFMADTGRLDDPACDRLTELRAAVVVFGALTRFPPGCEPEPGPAAA
jgi:hypothetical protein